MKKTSIGSWAYTIGPYESKPIDFDTVCKKLVEYQFDGVELGGFPPHPNPDDLPEKSQRDEIVGKMKDYGLGFSGLAANLWGEKLINTDDQSKYISEFTKNCKFCVDLGIKTIRVDTVQPPTIFSEVDEETAFKRVTETWNQCVKIAADHGLIVTWEFEPGFAFNKPSQILRVLDAVDAPNFGILYDTCHGNMVSVIGSRQPGEKETLAGGQVEFISKLSGRINHIHLIDSDNLCHKNANGEDETSTHMPFGNGFVDFDEVVPVLFKEKLPHDWITIDLCFWADAWGATKSCKDYLDKLIEKYAGSYASA